MQCSDKLVGSTLVPEVLVPGTGTVFSIVLVFIYLLCFFRLWRFVFKQATDALTTSWLALSSLGGSWKGSRQSSAGSFGPNVCSERSLNALANLSFSRSLPTASSPHAVSFVNGCARTSAHHSAMRPRRASVSASAYLEKQFPSTSTFPSNVELLVELGTRWRCDEWRNKQWGCDQWEG